jgi:hypothetical protein
MSSYLGQIGRVLNPFARREFADGNEANRKTGLLASLGQTVSSVTSASRTCFTVLNNAGEDTVVLAETVKIVGHSIIAFGPWIAPASAIVKVFNNSLSLTKAFIDSADLIPSVGYFLKGSYKKEITGTKTVTLQAKAPVETEDQATNTKQTIREVTLVTTEKKPIDDQAPRNERHYRPINKLEVLVTAAFTAVGVADWALWANQLKIVTISAAKCAKLVNFIRINVLIACAGAAFNNLDAIFKAANHQQLVNGALGYSAWGAKTLLEGASLYSLATTGAIAITPGFALAGIGASLLTIAHRVYYIQNKEKCDASPAVPAEGGSESWLTGRPTPQTTLVE